MSILTGPSIAPASGNKAKQLIIFLHGYGSSGDDLITLAPFFSKTLPDAEFLSPHAIEVGDYGMGYQWFSLLDRRPEKYASGIQRAAPKLQSYLAEKLAERNLTESDLALVGFSQGAMMALHTAPRREKPCAGVVAFSGALIAPELLAREIKSQPPVLIVHGEQDDVVPFDSMGAAESVLKENNFPVTSLACPDMAHSIDQAGLSAAISFLKEKFKV